MHEVRAFLHGDTTPAQPPGNVAYQPPIVSTIRRMASKGLTECWRDAMAAKPTDWKLMGVACGPREVDRKVHSSEEWCAWARGPNKERLEGRGTGPQDALLELTVKLKGLGA